MHVLLYLPVCMCAHKLKSHVCIYIWTANDLTCLTTFLNLMLFTLAFEYLCRLNANVQTKCKFACAIFGIPFTVDT